MRGTYFYCRSHSDVASEDRHSWVRRDPHELMAEALAALCGVPAPWALAVPESHWRPEGRMGQP